MEQGKIFDPKSLFQDFRTRTDKRTGRPGDRRDGKVYYYPESLVLVINVALATGRPLLLRGLAGCGKSSVAYNVARVLKRRYYEKVINSRMGARDLLWRFDAVRRLGDAQVRSTDPPDPVSKGDAQKLWQSYFPYIEPEILWWIFDRRSAERRGLPEDQALYFPEAKDPSIYKPKNAAPDCGAVILLDEIDKAEPDVPNNLLVALGSLQFQIEEIQRTIEYQKSSGSELKPSNLPLVIITTNEERQLPNAFLRRCIVYRFDPPDKNRLIDVVKRIEGARGLKLYRTVADTMLRLAKERAEKSREAFEPNIAEYIDAVRACKQLIRDAGDDKLIEDIVTRTTWKHPRLT